MHLVLSISVFSDELRELQPSVFIVDQLSACLPLLRWLWSSRRILFYCHFPDQLLARRDTRGILGLIKKLYRYVFDWFEVWTMTAADGVVVNSNFTKSVVVETFGKEIGNSARVVYPCVDTEIKMDTKFDANSGSKLWEGKKILLSINRFEEKKGIELAIRAYHGLNEAEREHSRLVIAGGYDPRILENVRYHKHLISLAESLGLTTATAKTIPTALAIPPTVSVIFLLSVPTSFKETLLRSATLLLYTPQNEHFGIVPVEAMFSGLPVLAATTGGPLETVVDGKTGWLRDVDDPAAWTAILRKVVMELKSPDIAAMGTAGKRRVEELFSRTVMARRFEEELQALLSQKKRKAFISHQDILRGFGVVAIFVVALVVAIFRGPPSKKPLRYRLS